jgi:putative DNA primase/helicase
MTYAPGKPTYHEGAFNRWRGLASSPKSGDVSPWNELLNFLFPGSLAERKYFEQWIAYPLQHLGTKLKTAVVLYSRTEGVGKNILVEAVERIYGTNAKEIGGDQLYKDFNSWQRDKQFIVGDEVQGGHDKREVIELLKRFITSPTFEINEKYKPHYSIPNVANFIFLTNNPDPFYIADEDRRFGRGRFHRRNRLPPEFYQRFHDWKESPEGTQHCIIICCNWISRDSIPTPRRR